MVKSISAARAKAQFSALLAEAAYGSRHIIIERRGKPVAALISMADLECLEQGQRTSSRPQGALALVGAWQEVGDDHLDAVIAEIYGERERDQGRPVSLEA